MYYSYLDEVLTYHFESDRKEMNTMKDNLYYLLNEINKTINFFNK